MVFLMIGLGIVFSGLFLGVNGSFRRNKQKPSVDPSPIQIKEANPNLRTTYRQIMELIDL